MVLPVITFTLFILSCSATVLNLEGSSLICLGSVAEVTCITNGTNSLGWRYNISTDTFYNSPNDVTREPKSVGPFVTQLTCVRGSEFTSVATVNVTSTLNGTTLDCVDDLFSNPSTDIKSLTFIVKEATDIMFLDVNTISSSYIYIFWSKATCIPRYNLTIDGKNFNTSTNSMKYQPNVGSLLQVSVYGMDYFGNIVNTVNKRYYFGIYNFIAKAIVQVVNVTGNNMTYADIIIVIEPARTEQSPLLSCEVTLINNDDLSTIETDCTQNLNLRFDAILGVNYKYQVDIENIVGNVTVEGSLIVPTTPTRYTTTAYTTSIITSTMEISPTTTPCSSCTCNVQNIGIGIIGIVFVASVIMFLIIIVIMFLKIYSLKKKVQQLEQEVSKPLQMEKL